MLKLHIFLVGISGCGKTILGQRVAQNLDLPFVHLDEQVEKMLGISVVQIKKKLGEALYQNAQTGVLIDLVGQTPGIISTSGGIALQKDSVQLMQNHGLIVHINKPLDQILNEQTTASSEHWERDNIVFEYNHSIGFYRACADYHFEYDKGFALGVKGLSELIELIGR